MKSLPDWLGPLGGKAAPSRELQVTPSVAPTAAPSVAPRGASQEAPREAPAAPAWAKSEVAAAVLPKPEDPVYELVEDYPSVRTLEPTARLDWPTRMDYAGYSELRALLASAIKRQGRPEVRRVWVEGRAPPWDPPTAAEHAFQLIRWLQCQPLFAGHPIPARDLKRLYPAFCTSLGLNREPWQTVSYFLRLLTGGKRHYRRIRGDNVRVYAVPEPANPNVQIGFVGK